MSLLTVIRFFGEIAVDGTKLLGSRSPGDFDRCGANGLWGSDSSTGELCRK